MEDITRRALDDELAAWLAGPDPERFPYDAVIAEFHRVGKHFVCAELLAALDRIRSMPTAQADRVLAGFLDTALDKHDGRYDNPSYLALSQLPLPGTGDCGLDLARAARQRDRLLAALVADTLDFVLAAADGHTGILPEQRPGARITAKRCILGVRALRPALERMGLAGTVTSEDPLTAARQACRAVLGALTPAERRLLKVTALPVYVVHDEYMFIRMLQAYETTFALLGVQIRAAVVALAEGRPAVAVEAMDGAERAMREVAALWSLVATMQGQSFLAFREFTDGASAIQSRGYKTVEGLCSTPDRERLDSPAYTSVPDVRARVLAGLPNLDEALSDARAAGRITAAAHDDVRAAMQRFEASLLGWRKTHFRLAVRMLGRRRGTGYTEGVPYLEKVHGIPLFRLRCPFASHRRPAVAAA